MVPLPGITYYTSCDRSREAVSFPHQTDNRIKENLVKPRASSYKNLKFPSDLKHAKDRGWKGDYGSKHKSIYRFKSFPEAVLWYAICKKIFPAKYP